MTNEINSIFEFIVIILSCILLAILPVNGTTLSEDVEIVTFLQNICNDYEKPCQVKLTNSPRIEGYLEYQGNIILSKGLRNVLTVEEVKAVGLHEIGHYHFHHYQSRDEFLRHWNFNMKELKDFRYRSEIQADLFATAYYLLHKEFNYLPNALSTLTKPELINQSSPTHPSTKDRIDYIKKFTDNYKLKVK